MLIGWRRKILRLNEMAFTNAIEDYYNLYLNKAYTHKTGMLERGEFGVRPIDANDTGLCRACPFPIRNLPYGPRKW